MLSFNYSYLPAGYESLTAYTHDRQTHTALLNSSRHALEATRLAFMPLKAIPGRLIVNVGAGSTTAHLPYYTYEANTALSPNLTTSLKTLLSDLYGRPVQLVFIKLTQPYLDADVLAAYLAQELAEYTFASAVRLLFAAASPLRNPLSPSVTTLPSSLVGIKVRLAGRLTTEPSRPRSTIKTATLGTLTTNRHTWLQTGAYTSVNLKNTFTVKVWLAQRAHTS